MIDKNRGFIQAPANKEEFHHNVQFQLDNVSGWVCMKKYEAALIKAQCLVAALKDAILFEEEK